MEMIGGGSITSSNTSLVLALEVGEPGKDDALLFAAAAQVGNWESWQIWTRERNARCSPPDPQETRRIHARLSAVAQAFGRGVKVDGKLRYLWRGRS